MKNTLTLLSLFAALTVQGQRSDTIVTGGALYWKVKGDYKWTQIPVSDTTACIMLVCDTTDYRFYILDHVWWLRGYRVTENTYTEGGLVGRMLDGTPTYTYERPHIQLTVTWLDDRKKPLGKNILVWQCL